MLFVCLPQFFFAGIPSSESRTAFARARSGFVPFPSHRLALMRSCRAFLIFSTWERRTFALALNQPMSGSLPRKDGTVQITVRHGYLHAVALYGTSHHDGDGRAAMPVECSVRLRRLAMAVTKADDLN